MAGNNNGRLTNAIGESLSPAAIKLTVPASAFFYEGLFHGKVCTEQGEVRNMPMRRPTRSNSRVDELTRFYRTLDHLEAAVGGKRRLSDCDGRMQWPARGVYFFFEAGERRSHSGPGLRVVRVGTHAVSAGSRTTLWKRLSQHRGVARTGGGNHRGSVFRLLVGSALMGRDPSCRVKTWGASKPGTEDDRAVERESERLVSRLIGKMFLLWLRVDDPAGRESLRGYIERNAIALLSNRERVALDPPSDGWLGLDCPKEAVRRSGLWNQRHVEMVHDPGFLPALERMADAHIASECRA